ncbi:MAG: DUF3370 domain-containing protein [Leptolyngbyaceae cyanobacterium bins.59]|nr:DUF3370 domain-containing protein [Leptolyngbyaceae cyanobacterium bins.59]
MLFLFLQIPVAQITPPPEPQRPPEIRIEEAVPAGGLQILEELDPKQIIVAQEVRPLPGQLDAVPVFNSNSPEVVLTEGILLSTFPPDGKANPSAHLNFPFNGRFDIFSHHISRGRTPEETRSLIQSILIQNPSSSETVTLDIQQAATYLTRPDALFVELPAFVEDPLGRVFSGPGSRVVSDILRGRRQGNWPSVVKIPPGESYLLMNLPIPIGSVVPSSNGRSTLIRAWSSAPVYVATLAMFAPRDEDGEERLPTLEEWLNLLQTGTLAGPRDLAPTPPQATGGDVIYGRVAGVALGSEWRTQLTDQPNGDSLKIPAPGKAFSYGISLLPRGTFGTNQIQSAKILARYSDTAYRAHGNYGVHYSLTLPLHNPTNQTQTVTLSIQTPIKEDTLRGGVRFLDPPENRIFFRGTVRVRYTNDQGLPQTRFVHLVQQRGQQGSPLVQLQMPGGDRRLVQVDLLYPPDATPPQVLTVQTMAK